MALLVPLLGNTPHIIFARSFLLQFCILGVVSVSALIYGCAEAFGINLYVPTRHWLVPKRWSVWRPPTFEMLFGLILGAGFFTVIPFIGLHLILLICVFNDNLIEDAIITTTFALMRGIPLLAIPITYYIKDGKYGAKDAMAANTWFRNVSEATLLRGPKIICLLGLSGAAVSTAVF